MNGRMITGISILFLKAYIADHDHHDDDAPAHGPRPEIRSLYSQSLPLNIPLSRNVYKKMIIMLTMMLMMSC